MNSAICKPLATSAFMSQASIGTLAAILILVAGLLAPHPLAAQRPERPTLEITGYVIDAEIETTTHHLAAKTTVTFKAPDNSEMVSFGFHPALKVNNRLDPAIAHPGTQASDKLREHGCDLTFVRDTAFHAFGDKLSRHLLILTVAVAASFSHRSQ